MENVQIEKVFLLGYDDIYDDAGIDPKKFLQTLPATEALKFISYLLHLYNVRKRSDFRFQSDHLLQWMMQLESIDKNKVATFVQQQATFIFDPSFKLIDRRPCLDLIQHILVYSSQATRTLTTSDYTFLFKCLLHFNSKENRVQEHLFQWKGNGNIEDFVNHILPVQVRNIEHERFKNYVIQFLKVYYFLEFCENHPKYAGYLNLFLSSLGLNSHTIYLWKLINPFHRLMLSEAATPVMYIDDSVEGLEFYNRLTINGKIKECDKDYKPLRQYPLFKEDKNTYVFLDYRFFIDKFYQGFLFDFSSITKVSFNNLKENMGNEFSEHILFYTVMAKCFTNSGSVHLTGHEIKAKIGSGEPDYYIRNGADLFLFEFKDIVVTADIKYSLDPEKIKKGIIEKLERNSTGQGKGISQLLNTINSISNNLYKLKAVDDISPEQLVFYPIIIHTDITFESGGVNYFLNKRMMGLIEELGLFNVQIKGLVMINIDTLILFQDQFQERKLDFGNCIASYLSYVSSNNPQTATFPFDEFLKHHFVKTTGEKIGTPKDFARIINSFRNT